MGLVFCPQAFREPEFSVAPCSPAQAQIFDPAVEAHQMVTVWSNGQTQGREPRDPGMEFIVGGALYISDGILLLLPLIIPKHL